MPAQKVLFIGFLWIFVLIFIYLNVKINCVYALAFMCIVPLIVCESVFVRSFVRSLVGSVALEKRLTKLMVNLINCIFVLKFEPVVALNIPVWIINFHRCAPSHKRQENHSAQNSLRKNVKSFPLYCFWINENRELVNQAHPPCIHCHTDTHTHTTVQCATSNQLWIHTICAWYYSICIGWCAWSAHTL